MMYYTSPIVDRSVIKNIDYKFIKVLTQVVVIREFRGFINDVSRTN